MDLRRAGEIVARHVPAAAPALKAAYRSGERWRTALEQNWPALIRARTEKITVAITAHCNLRCQGCRYGRDFMPGSILRYGIVEELLEDAAAAKIPSVRLYGGEPLLHPQLPKMFETASRLGVDAYLTTNALVLDHKIDALYAASLRKATIGYYGRTADYDAYVQRPGRYARLMESLENVRRAYGPDRLDLQFNFLLSRRSATIEHFEHLRRLAEKFDARIQIDIVHYSLPYFQEGPERELQFREDDADPLNRLTEHLVRLKQDEPFRLTETQPSLASIPDWAIKTDQMKVPCDARKLLWVGADGGVNLCYVTFPLGNLHAQRLSTFLYGNRHHQAARDAFKLNCPNCHCERGARVEKHGPSYAAYSAKAAAMAPLP
jgi:MoaA/NifB/PqqE/SkfB family radical SAM enzyme